MKITMLFDMTIAGKTYKGRRVFSGNSYEVIDKVGQQLIDERKAIPYKPKKHVKITRADGKVEEISWGEYLKEKRM